MYKITDHCYTVPMEDCEPDRHPKVGFDQPAVTTASDKRLTYKKGTALPTV